VKKTLPPIKGQTRYEKFIDFLAFKYSALLCIIIHLGSICLLLVAMLITQDVLNSPALLDLSIMIWLVVEALNVIFGLLSASAEGWGLRHEREIAARIEDYITQRNDCTYDELAVHCMPRKIHVGLESAVQTLVYFRKIVRYTDNGTIRLRLPMEEERLTWYIESGEELSFSEIQDLFHDVVPTYDDYLEIEFFLFETLRCRMGQISCSNAEGYIFWFCAEDIPKVSFTTFEDIFSAPLFDGKALRDLWPDAIVTEINGEYAEEWLHVYNFCWHRCSIESVDK